MTDQIDNLEPADRTHGLRGVIRHAPKDEAVAAAYPPADPDLPDTYDATHGEKVYGMQGNDKWPNCFWAAVAHATTVQALTGLDDKGHPTFVEGAVIPHPDEAVEWYKVYCEANGQPPTPLSDGTSPYAGAKSILAQGLAEYVGVLGPEDRDAEGNSVFDASIIEQAIYDTQGGVIICLALDPDAEKEFDDHVPWGTQSSSPDAEDGHAVTGVAYDPTNKECITWAQLQLMTNEFDINCIDGLVLVLTKHFQGDDAAVAAKWGLTSAATLAASAPDQAPPVTTPTNDTPVAPKGPEDLLARARGIEADLRHLVEMAVKRLPEEDIIKAMEQMIEFYVKIP
ncbi:MAG TPA: hypothetical protein VG246_13185 [Acidimicrobiales bacterium]|jgi:hypothetical protein|nr:hypothetical protein [Acidimicrobiales bacterium]